MATILVVEDDTDLNKTACSYLEMRGFAAIGAANAPQAYDALYRGGIDAIVSDIMMPGVDGFELASNIRAVDANIPILFMTARDDMVAKQRGYASGIDDYMVKPIDLEELVLRLRALLRRAGINASRRLEVGSLVLDADEHAAYVDGEEIPVTVREFSILHKLLSYPRKTFTRAQLMNEFWGSDSTSGTRTVDVYMAKLRQKFARCDAFEIVTVHGLGYKAVLHEQA